MTKALLSILASLALLIVFKIFFFLFALICNLFIELTFICNFTVTFFSVLAFICLMYLV